MNNSDFYTKYKDVYKVNQNEKGNRKSKTTTIFF